MSAILGAIFKLLGPTVCVAIAIIVYYEGVPFVKDIPYIGVIAEGAKRAYANQQVALATQGMVLKAELDAANALLEKARQEAAFNLQVADTARKQAENSEVEKQAAQDELDKRIAQDTGPDGCTVTDDDFKWMHHQ
jgi:hypothetical protein